jgi:hypothetical protein
LAPSSAAVASSPVDAHEAMSPAPRITGSPPGAVLVVVAGAVVVVVDGAVVVVVDPVVTTSWGAVAPVSRES